MTILELKNQIRVASEKMRYFYATTSDEDLYNAVAYLSDIEIKLLNFIKDTFLIDGYDKLIFSNLNAELKKCISAFEIHSNTYAAQIAISILDQCLEILENMEISGSAAGRRAESKDCLYHKAQSILLDYMNIDVDDTSARYNIIEKLVEITEYIDRELELEKDNDQSHIYIKSLKNMKYDLLNAINFFVSANITYTISAHDFNYRAISIMNDIMSHMDRKINLSVYRS